MTNGRVVTEGDIVMTSAAPRGRLGRYAWYQLKDFAVQRGLAMLVIALTLAYPVISSSHAPRHVVVRGPAGPAFTRLVWPDPVTAAEHSLAGVLFPVIILGAVLAVRGLVSQDRQDGYYRFAFAKPINITRYYAQSYAVQFAGFMAVVALLVALFALFMRPLAMMPGLLGAAAIFFALVGSVGFLLSTLVRAEWVWLVGAFGVSSIVGGYSKVGHPWLAPLAVLLPPAGDLTNVMEALASPARDVPTAALLWVLGYAAACTAAALLLIRRRAFA